MNPLIPASILSLNMVHSGGGGVHNFTGKETASPIKLLENAAIAYTMVDVVGIFTVAERVTVPDPVVTNWELQGKQRVEFWSAMTK